MKKINDLTNELHKKVNLVDCIDKNLKISYGSKKFFFDLKKGLKDLNIRKKNLLRIDKLKSKSLDTFFCDKNKVIDINTTKNNSLNKKFIKVKFILKKNFKKNNRLGFPKKYKVIFFSIIFFVFFIFLDIFLLWNNTINGYEKLISIKDNFSDIDSVKKNIKGAQNNFFFSKILFIPFSIIPNQKLDDLSNIISGGKYLSSFLDEGFFLYENLNSLVNKNKVEDINFIKLLENIRVNSENLNKNIKNALINYNKIGNLGDKNLNKKLLKTRKKLKEIYGFIDKINRNYDTILELLGKNGKRKYLVVFQNNDEIRSTGGFMGSFSTIYLYNGKIEKFDNKDVYAYEWIINKFYKKKEKAPEGLNKITRTFGLRDANYYPEIKDSAEKIKFFFDKMAYDIDGIIFINQNLIRDLIDTIGFVDSKSLGEKITSDNFSMIVSTLVEAEVSKIGTIGTPKQVLFDFSKEFYAKLLGERKYYDYLNIILKNIKSRDIVFYSFHSKENSLLWKFGLNGEINFSETMDFSYPVYTSVGGNKTDRYINYKYEKNIFKIPGSCNFKTEFRIYEESNFSNKDKNEIERILSKYKKLGKNKIDILNIQGMGENKSYLRILLPKNIKVELLPGQKITKYEKYNILEFYTYTKSSGKSMYEINYTLNNPKCETYNYKLIKQPGIKKYDITFISDGKTNIYENIKTDFIYKGVVN